MKSSNEFSYLIGLFFIIILGYSLSISFNKVPDFVVATFSVFIGFMLAFYSERLIESKKHSEYFNKLLENLMNELESNYNKLSGEKPHEILMVSAYESAKSSNRLDLLDYDTAYKITELYDKIIRINDDVTRLLNFVYSSAQMLSTFNEDRDSLKKQITDERNLAKDLTLHIIGLLRDKYGIPTKIHA